MFDIIFVQNHPNTEDTWKLLKAQFPLAKKVSSFEKARKVALTEFFWIVPDDIVVDNLFDFSYVPDEWSKEYVHVFKNGDTYDGIALIPTSIKLSSREIEHRFYINKKEIDIVASHPKPYDLFVIDNYKDYKYALETSSTELFWMSSNMIVHDVDLVNNYYISHHDSQLRNQTHAFIHNVDEQRLYNGLFLCSKRRELSEREVEYRFPVNRIEHDTVGSTKKPYSIVVCNTYDEYIAAIDNTSITELFWTFTPNVKLDPSFSMDLYFTHDNEYDRKSNHNFIHRVDGNDYRNGVFLLTKHRPLTQREFDHRFIVDAKEWDIVASGPVEYPVYEIDSYDEYLAAFDDSKTEMFWMSSRNISATIPDLYFTHDNEYDRKQNHAFIHRVGDKDLYNGLFLCSKHRPLTEREIKYRHIVNRKEWDIVGSGPVQYDHFYIETYNDYLKAMEFSKTELFWADSDNIKSTIPDIYFTHDNEFDRTHNHNFLHVDGKRNGLFLLSKHAPVTEREIEHRFIVNAKEWHIVGSDKISYPVYEIDTYDEYLAALDDSKSEMFWMSSRNITADIPDLYFTHDNEFDRKQNHAFIHRVGDKELYNGLFLCSKHRPLTEREVEYRHIVNRKEWDIVASGPKSYDIFEIDSYDDYLRALENSTTEMFWGTSCNLTATIPDLYFTHDNEYDRKSNHNFWHHVKDKFYRNGVFLFSKHSPVTEREIEHRFIVNAKEWDIVASMPIEYDIFNIETYDDYQFALENSKTELFWATSHNITYQIPDLYFTHDNEYDRKANHTFIHAVKDKNLRNGLFLLSKHRPLTAKEIDHRFIVNAKEWDIIGSTSVMYPVYEIDTYDEYLQALENTETEMFWMSSRNIDTSDFRFDIYFSHNNEYDRKQNHAFIHRVDNKTLYNGVFLCSKHRVLTQKEVEHRHIVNRKEWNIVASGPKKYDVFVVDSYEDYLNAYDNTTTEMFWATSNNLKAADDFGFDIYFSHDNAYDRTQNHVFVHRVGDRDLYNGIFLLSKHRPLTKREVEHRYIVNRKEWDIVASGPVEYEQFIIDTYEDYETALNDSETEMFWMIPPEVTVDPNFKFNLYFTHNQWFERETNHVFKNGTAWDGVSLVSKKSLITEREINMRFLANKKQYDVVASNPRPYDIVFISKDEEHADHNYNNLLERFPRAKRIHGVEGIHQAHIEAAKLCDTNMFWVVDADAEIIDKFAFDYYVPAYDPDGRKTVHVWKAQNPINSLVYGYGAVKLLPRLLTLNMNTAKPDMTTSISPYFKSINRISNITRFNTDAFSTWRSAFRECVKLASKSIDGQLDEETEFRLKIWCTRGADKPFGEYCIAGANVGKLYGETHRGDIQALAMINNFDWLQEQFKQSNQ